MKWAALKPRLPRSIRIFHDIDDTRPASAVQRPPPVPHTALCEGIGLFAGYPCHNSRIIAWPIRPPQSIPLSSPRRRTSRPEAIQARIHSPARVDGLPGFIRHTPSTAGSPSRHPQRLPPFIPCMPRTILLRCRYGKSPLDCEAIRSCPRPTMKDHTPAAHPM